MNSAKSLDQCNQALETTLDKLSFRLSVAYSDYNEAYVPSTESRATTNFVNLARGPERIENLQGLFDLINQRLNTLMPLSGRTSSNYKIKLSIVSISATFGDGPGFLLSEMLKANVIDQNNGEEYEGAFGLNLSSFVRDFDFVHLVPRLKNSSRSSNAYREIGKLHGLLYKLQFQDFWKGGVIDRPAVTAISVSSQRHYKMLDEVHPILGIRYLELPKASATTSYFEKMGLAPAFFMPEGNQAPMAIYMKNADPSCFTSTELVTLIAVMDSFQRIYRPEIYNLEEKAGSSFHPSLIASKYIIPPINYDRDERGDLARQQADKVEKEFLLPYTKELKSMLTALNS